MRNSQPFLSIIVPAYNEEKRCKKGITEIIQFINSQKFKTEVLLVNDGSTDNTLKLLKEIKHPSIQLISYTKNQGKGYAIKEGMKKAQGKYKLFMDIDLSTPISEFNKFLPFLSKFDIIIGSRKTKNSKILIHQPFLRERLGIVFTWLPSLLLKVNISDFTCGYKCFSRKASEEIFPLQSLKRWGFDSEILFIAQKKKFSIKEIPVIWSNDSRTKVSLFKDVIISFWELIKIKINDIHGKYQ